MGDRQRRPDTPASAEAMFGPARPVFGRVRKGYDPAEVRPYLDMLERERSDLGAALVLTQARARELSTRLARYEALEEELTRAVHVARESADALVAEAEAKAARVVADAEETAARRLAEGRERLAEESRELETLHLAIAAEAASLESLQDTSTISRAAAALVDIVDRPGGLGPFSQATSTLLEFAQLLHRTARAGVGGEDAAAGIDLTEAAARAAQGAAPEVAQAAAPAAGQTGEAHAPGREDAAAGARAVGAPTGPVQQAGATPIGAVLPVTVS